MRRQLPARVKMTCHPPHLHLYFANASGSQVTGISSERSKVSIFPFFDLPSQSWHFCQDQGRNNVDLEWTYLEEA